MTFKRKKSFSRDQPNLKRFRDDIIQLTADKNVKEEKEPKSKQSKHKPAKGRKQLRREAKEFKKMKKRAFSSHKMVWSGLNELSL